MNITLFRKVCEVLKRIGPSKFNLVFSNNLKSKSPTIQITQKLIISLESRYKN
jgi:hypothetical protein